MPGIFISYRRDDSAGHAGRLYDDLTGHFGPDRVFIPGMIYGGMSAPNMQPTTYVIPIEPLLTSLGVELVQ